VTRDSHGLANEPDSRESDTDAHTPARESTNTDDKHSRARNDDGNACLEVYHECVANACLVPIDFDVKYTSFVDFSMP